MRPVAEFSGGPQHNHRLEVLLSRFADCITIGAREYTLRCIQEVGAMIAMTFKRAGFGLSIGALLAVAGCGGGNDNTAMTFTPFEISFAVAAADFNGDGLADVLDGRTLHQPSSPFESGSLHRYLHNTGAGTGYGAPTVTAAGIEPLYLASADINGDGLSDVVSSSIDDGKLFVYLNQLATPGTFAAPVQLVSAGTSQVAIGDLNGDGHPDLVSADYGVNIFVQDTAALGTFLAPASLSSGGASWVAIGDLNQDGMPDLVVTDVSGVKIYFHSATASSASFMTPVSVFTQTPNQAFTAANYLAIADLDGDGKNDLVITDPGPYGPTPPTINVRLQDHATPGAFLAPVSFSLPNGHLAQSIVVADLNGDTFQDVIVGDNAGVNVLLQNASSAGTFAAANYYATANGAFQVAVADVNDDGLPDLVTSNSATTPLASGTYVTQPGVLLQSATTPGTFASLANLP
jgi:FG-GAP-like repeat